jgi:predicted DNA binding protein
MSVTVPVEGSPVGVSVTCPKWCRTDHSRQELFITDVEHTRDVFTRLDEDRCVLAQVSLASRPFEAKETDREPRVVLSIGDDLPAELTPTEAHILASAFARGGTDEAHRLASALFHGAVAVTLNADVEVAR